MADRGVKLVVVGDGNVGKTCLLISYANDRFPEEYVPTVFDNYIVNLTAGEETIELGLWDTAGQEEYDRLRPLSYHNADVFLICFSVVSPVSFQNIQHKWFEEVQRYKKDDKVPVILVGTKTDLRDVHSVKEELRLSGYEAITPQEGANLAKKLKVFKYLECSARTGQSIKEIFDTAVKAVLFKGKKRRSKGCVLY